MFVIEKNIPIPSGRKKSDIVGILKNMEIGDSVELPWEKYRYIHSYARLCGIKIKCRAENEKYRIWRIS